MKKLMFIGGGGILGKYFVRSKLLKNFVFVTYLENQPNYNNQNIKLVKLDITDKKNCAKKIKKISPDVIVHAASIGNIDNCERRKRDAFHVNYIGVKHVLDGIGDDRVKLIFISTSNVYSGRKLVYSESDNPRPLNYYANTKLLAEKYLIENCRNLVILRPATMYGWNDTSQRKNLVSNVIEWGMRSKVIRVSRDRYTNFLYAGDAVKFIHKAMNLASSKITVNIAGSACLSYYDFAVQIYNKFFDKKLKIKPVLDYNFRNIADRPKRLCLNINKARKLFKFTPISTAAGLRIMENEK